MPSSETKPAPKTAEAFLQAIKAALVADAESVEVYLTESNTMRLRIWWEK
jgi:hypothetical protein